jgi:hypothetical protein
LNNDRIWSYGVRRSALSGLIAFEHTAFAPGRQLGNGLRRPGLRIIRNAFAEFGCCLIVVGVALWLVNRYIPMASSIFGSW